MIVIDRPYRLRLASDVGANVAVNTYRVYLCGTYDTIFSIASRLKRDWIALLSET